MNWAWVAMGGAVGAMLRYGVMLLPWAASPMGTLLVNMAGCAVMGALVGAGQVAFALPEPWRLAVMVGGLGALTTFSSFALDAFILWERGQSLHAMLYVVVSVIGALGCFALGLEIVKGCYG